MAAAAAYSVAAGLCGASAAVVGKLALDTASPALAVVHTVCDVETQHGYACSKVATIAGVGLMLFLNTLMLKLFVQSLERAGSVVTTVVNSGVNFVCSAVLGRLVFGEALSLQWWYGASFILLGVVLIAYGSQDSTATKSSPAPAPASAAPDPDPPTKSKTE